MTIRGYDADANTRFRSRRGKARGDVRRVPGGHKVTPLSSHGKTEPSRAGRGERKLLSAWDNVGGRGTTVEWIPCDQDCEPGTECRHGRTQIREMAKTGKLPLSEVFPHTEPGIRTIAIVKNGKVTAVQVRLSTDAKVDGDCYNVGAHVAGESRPDRWSEHGKHVNGSWQAGARFNTEKLAFSWDVDRGKD